MTYVTLTSARAAASARGLTRTLAEAEMRKAASAPLSTQYDVFLSHAREDVDVVAGLRSLLEREGLTVYVYWMEPQPTQVTPETAAKLRTRMEHCKSLIYASSHASPNSKWMPWELGYFDGYRPGHVAILPLVAAGSSSFVGQEYLALYPHVEQISWTDGRRGLGVRIGTNQAEAVRTFVTRAVTRPA